MLRRIALAAVSLALCLMAAELLLRRFPLPAPGRIHWTPDRSFVLRDPELIWRLAPNASSVFETKEFREVRWTNSIGIRDREVEPRVPGETRMLAVGDSFTYGHGVSADESYPKVLERLLRADGNPTSVFNAGVPGYGIDQVYRIFPERVAQIDPDLILVGVHCSDLEEGWLWPLYDLRDGELVALPAWRNGVALQGRIIDAAPRWLYDSALFQQIARRIPGRDPFGQRPPGSRAELRDWARDKIELEIAAIDAGATSPGRAPGAASASGSGDAVPARDPARGRSGRAMVILMPCKENLEPANPSVYADLGARLEARAIPVLDGMTALRDAGGDPAAAFFVEDIHLNATGNRILAAAASRFVRERMPGIGTAPPSPTAPLGDPGP